MASKSWLRKKGIRKMKKQESRAAGGSALTEVKNEEPAAPVLSTAEAIVSQHAQEEDPQSVRRET
jgi:hypothetical protein